MAGKILSMRFYTRIALFSRRQIYRESTYRNTKVMIQTTDTILHWGDRDIENQIHKKYISTVQQENL